MPLSVFEDRGLTVPNSQRVFTDYVNVKNITMACKDRMAIGDVERAMQRRMSAAGAGGQPFPCPVGHWKKKRFVIEDGRHEFVAALMLGVEYILVAWIEDR